MLSRYFPRSGGLGKAARLALPRATASNNQRGTAVTFKTSGNWIAPAGVQFIQVAYGEGSDGKPESGQHIYFNGYDEWTQSSDHNDITGENTVYPEVYVGQNTGPVPSPYCTSETIGPNTQRATCHRFAYAAVDQGDYLPASPGTAATIFGKSFPGGGVGLQANRVNYFNITVKPGTNYPVSVPAGGYITIEF